MRLQAREGSEAVTGQPFFFDPLDPAGYARALSGARSFRADSVRGLRVAPSLRALSWDELYAAIRAGAAKVREGSLVPSPAGASDSLYVAIPYTSNAAVKVATATTAKTLIQVATPSTQDIDIIQWSCSFDASSAATPIIIELLQFDVAATVTSLTPTPLRDPNAPASLCVGGASATGYNASAEGSPTTTFIKDVVYCPPTNGVIVQYPLGHEPGFPISKFVRLRATGASSDTPNALPSIMWKE